MLIVLCITLICNSDIKKNDITHNRPGPRGFGMNTFGCILSHDDCADQFREKLLALPWNTFHDVNERNGVYLVNEK